MDVCLLIRLKFVYTVNIVPDVTSVFTLARRPLASSSVGCLLYTLYNIFV